MELGKLGVWTWVDGFPPDEAAGFARQLEEWGYAALWIPEAVGANPFAMHGFLAAHTERLVLATGIASIYARDAMATRAACSKRAGVATAAAMETCAVAACATSSNPIAALGPRARATPSNPTAALEPRSGERGQSQLKGKTQTVKGGIKTS